MDANDPNFKVYLLQTVFKPIIYSLFG